MAASEYMLDGRGTLQGLMSDEWFSYIAYNQYTDQECVCQG